MHVAMVLSENSYTLAVCGGQDLVFVNANNTKSAQ